LTCLRSNTCRRFVSQASSRESGESPDTSDSDPGAATDSLLGTLKNSLVQRRKLSKTNDGVISWRFTTDDTKRMFGLATVVAEICRQISALGNDGPQRMEMTDRYRSMGTLSILAGDCNFHFD